MIEIAALVAAVVEFLRRLKANDFWAAGTIACAGVVGAVVGYLHLVAGVDTLHGVIGGLSASGLITIAQNFGQKSVNSERLR